MKTFPTSAILITAACIAAGASTVHAQDWKFGLAPSVTTGYYPNSAVREHYLERGATLTANYRDQGGLTLGMSKTFVDMKNTIPDTDQSNLLLSGHWSFQTSALPGRWTTRMALNGVRNDDQSNVTNRVAAFAPQLSWLSVDRTLYADVGLAKSYYQSDLIVNQVTPTLGFSLNDGYEWVQLRAYLISGMNPLLASGKSSTSAVELKWTHFLSASSFAMKPSSFTVGLMSGERIYAVDMDAQSVANLSDIQTGSANVGVTWQLAKTAKMFVLLGQSQFRNTALNNDYQLNVAHATLALDF